MEEALCPVPEPGQPNPPRPGKEETKSLPKCTTEGVGYYNECWKCRLKGKMFRYVGESSRSAHQRGKEHMREITKGKKTHTLAIHFIEEHNGARQEILLRIVGKFRTPLERQVWELVEIDSTMAKLGHTHCLNSRNEWGMSKDPVLVSRDQRPQKVHTAQQEYKRVPERDSEDPQDSDRPNKKQRVNVTRTTQEVVKCITKVTYDSVTKVTR